MKTTEFPKVFVPCSTYHKPHDCRPELLLSPSGPVLKLHTFSVLAGTAEFPPGDEQGVCSASYLLRGIKCNTSPI